jgi:EmrB/QacA subfamily drug resistance transporter
MTMSAVDAVVVATSDPGAERKRWLALGVICIAQLMVVLDLTVMNIALPSAQRALHFSTADRQWVVTAYSLAAGSLLLAGGKLSDLIGRKTTFLAGLIGFAGVSAIGGASTNFATLVAARAFQGVFSAILVPASLALLITSFTSPKDRAKALGIFGAIAAGGGAIGLVLGGALTDYLSWRWTLYINLVFAGVAVVGGILLLDRETVRTKVDVDVPGVVLASGGLFCIVFGFSNAATHSWHSSGTWGSLAGGVALLAAFAIWISRVANPILPPRILLSRTRGGGYIAVFISALCLFAMFFFLTYYLQRTLGYSPIKTGVAFLPNSAVLAIAANLATIVLLPRVGARVVVASGLLIAAGAMGWLAQLGPHTSFAKGILGPIMLAGFGFGMVFAAAFTAGTYGVEPQDAAEASATVSVGQQLGASLGTALLNTLFASAVANYLASHASSATSGGRAALGALAQAHGYDTAFWWTCGIAAGGAIVVGALLPGGRFADASSSTPDITQPAAHLEATGA